MRKLLWSGVAALVIGAAASYVVVYHAAKNPTSALGRCATAAATFGLTGNPVEAVRNLHGAADESGHVVQLDKPGDEHEVKPPVPDVEDFPPVHEAEEIINVPMPEDNLWQRVWSNDLDGGPRHTEHRSRHDDYDYVMPPPIDEPVMPDVIEEDVELDCPPAVMGGIWGMIGNCVQAVAKPAVMDECPYPLQLCLPQMPAVPFTAERQIDLAWIFRDVCPGFFQRLAEYVRSEQGAAGEEVSEPAQEPMSTVEPMTDGEEATTETPARDPNYHRYHYQGCPYSGCPYPHAYTPPVYTPPVCMPPVPTAAPAPAPECKPVVKKKKPFCGNVHMSFWRHVMSGEQGPCGPVNVDTMECRPSDLNLDLLLPHFPF